MFVLTFVGCRCLHHVVSITSIIFPIIFVPTLIIFHLKNVQMFVKYQVNGAPARQAVEVPLCDIVVAQVHHHAADSTAVLVQPLPLVPQPPGSRHPHQHGEQAQVEPFLLVDSET